MVMQKKKKKKIVFCFSSFYELSSPLIGLFFCTLHGFVFTYDAFQLSLTRQPHKVYGATVRLLALRTFALYHGYILYCMLSVNFMMKWLVRD